MRHLRFGLACIALAAGSAAAATSIVAEQPHRPAAACAAIKVLVAGINDGDLRAARVPYPGLAFYSDSLGRVESAEEERFLHALRHSDGRRDAEPMRLAGVYRVQGGKFDAVYLVALQRKAWRETRIVMNADINELSVERVADPGFGTDFSYWLATFRSDELNSFREAPELHRLQDERRTLRNCAG